MAREPRSPLYVSVSLPIHCIYVMLLVDKMFCSSRYHFFSRVALCVGVVINDHVLCYFNGIYPGGGGYMTCGWTGVCRPAFRKAPSSNYRKLPSYPLLWWFLAENHPFVAIFRQFLDNLPFFYGKSAEKGTVACLENLGPKNPPIWAAHTRTLNMLCTPPPPPGECIHKKECWTCQKRWACSAC